MKPEPHIHTPAHDPGRSICEPSPHGYELPPIGPSMGTPDWWRRNVATEPSWWRLVFAEPFVRGTIERTITAWPGEVSRDDAEVQYQAQKMRSQGYTHVEYQQVNEFTAKLIGRSRWGDSHG